MQSWSIPADHFPRGVIHNNHLFLRVRKVHAEAGAPCSIHVYALHPAQVGRDLTGPTLLAMFELPCKGSYCEFYPSAFSAGYGRRFEPDATILHIQGVNVYVRDSTFLRQSSGSQAGSPPRFIPWSEWSRYTVRAPELDECQSIACLGFRAVHIGFVLDFNQYDIAHDIYGSVDVVSGPTDTPANGPSTAYMAPNGFSLTICHVRSTVQAYPTSFVPQ